MKKTTITLITAVILGSVTIGTQTIQAAEYDSATSGTSKGTITILENESPDPDVPDPDNPDNPINPDPDNPINPTPGLLRINYISDFEFGSQKNSSGAIDMQAKLDVLYDQNGEEVERVPFVSTEDRRGSEREGWELQVSQTTPFTDSSGHELVGATISLSNLRYATGTNAPAVTVETIALNEEGQTLSSANATQGSGAWSLALGNPTLEGTTDGVRLQVPANTVKNDTEYQATLLWELIADPTASDENN